MSTNNFFEVPTYEDANPETQLIFDQLKKAVGILPNLYAMISYSGNGLSSYMAYVQAQSKGKFHAKDREAIFLIVSELNGCLYCLSSHTVSAIQNHWTIEEILHLRSGTITDPKLQVIYDVIKSVIENKGEVSDGLLNAYWGAGFDKAALVDLLILINVMTFTNYLYRLTKIPIDFPLATSINDELPK